MTDADERVLAAAAAAGDERAFGRLMRRHKDRLFRIIRRLTNDDDATLEILQDSFVAMWRAIGRFDPERPFLAWATRITINKARDWRRRERVRQAIRLFLPVETAARQPDLAPLADQQLAATRDMDRIAAALVQVPLHLREPLVLTAIDGMSYAEAAEVLGITRKAVETRIARARSQLARSCPDLALQSKPDASLD